MQGAELKTVSHQIIGPTPECWQPGGFAVLSPWECSTPQKSWLRVVSTPVQDTGTLLAERPLMQRGSHST